MINIAKATSAVELPLDLTQITIVAAIFIFSVGGSKEVGTYMLDGIES